MSNIKHLTDDTFEAEIASGSALVDFHAEWCGPCKMMNPIIEALALETKGSLHVCKVDVDHAQKVAARFDITSVPTLILFENGKEKKRMVGLQDLKSLKSHLAK